MGNDYRFFCFGIIIKFYDRNKKNKDYSPCLCWFNVLLRTNASFNLDSKVTFCLFGMFHGSNSCVDFLFTHKDIMKKKIIFS